MIGESWQELRLIHFHTLSPPGTYRLLCISQLQEEFLVVWPVSVKWCLCIPLQKLHKVNSKPTTLCKLFHGLVVRVSIAVKNTMTNWRLSYNSEILSTVIMERSMTSCWMQAEVDWTSSWEFYIWVWRQRAERKDWDWLEHLNAQSLPPVAHLLQQSHINSNKAHLLRVSLSMSLWEPVFI